MPDLLKATTVLALAAIIWQVNKRNMRDYLETLSARAKPYLFYCIFQARERTPTYRSQHPELCGSKNPLYPLAS